MDTETFLGKTHLRVKRIGFGGIPIQRLTFAEAERVIKKAAAAGINLFDTSRIYTDSEEKFGRVLKDHRQDVVIASKSYSRTGKGMGADIETSLKALQTDFIDLYQCHNIGSDEELGQILGPAGALEGLLRARKEGKIRYIGISGHKPRILLKSLQAFDFDTIQVPLNIIEGAAVDELIPYANREKIGVIAMKPMAGGAIINRGLNLRFILTHGADAAIPGMASPQEVSENLSVLDNLQPLDAEDMRILDQEKEKLGENFCRRCEYCLPCPEGLPISFLHTLSAYYFRYRLKDWAWERINGLPKSYKDCTVCGECSSKCPYNLDNPRIFMDTWAKILADREG